MIQYRKGSLFEAPTGSYLLHSCNAMGKWGGGPNAIATQMADGFPKALAEYKAACAKGVIPSSVIISSEEIGYRIISIIASQGYGKNVSPPEIILKATEIAFRRLPTDAPIHMPRINSGLFRVPWEQTAQLLKPYEHLDITVWTQ